MNCQKCGKHSGRYPLCKECYHLGNDSFWETLLGDVEDESENEDDLTCPICGEPTRIYMGNARKDRLCPKHADMLKAGEIYADDKGIFRDAKAKKPLVKQATFSSSVRSPEIPDPFELTCLLCGEVSNGKHFCLKCYKEYKDHSIDIRITNCKDVEIIDKYGNKKVKTKDGRFVRSLSEKIILDYFFDHFIRIIYEKTVPYINEKGETAELHPDFYLPDYDLYIEFNGLTNKKYLRQKEYVNKIYAAKGYTVVILESDDINDIESTLDQVLEKYKK